MPRSSVNGVDLHYREQGAGPQAIVFAHGLLMAGSMFDAQAAAFQGRYRCIDFDFRGQGRSQVARDGYDMDTLTADAAAVIRELHVGPCHFVGLSMGGFIGLRLAARQPQLLRSLTLLGSSAGPERRWFRYRLMTLWARLFGFGLLTTPVIMRTLFAAPFLHDPAREDERRRWRAHLRANDRVGSTRAAAAVIGRAGVEGELGRIRLPTLVMVGAEDRANPPELSRRLHEGIAGSRLVIVPAAGHSLAIERPDAVNEALAAFLAEVDG